MDPDEKLLRELRNDWQSNLKGGSAQDEQALRNHHHQKEKKKKHGSENSSAANGGGKDSKNRRRALDDRWYRSPWMLGLVGAVAVCVIGLLLAPSFLCHTGRGGPGTKGPLIWSRLFFMMAFVFFLVSLVPYLLAFWKRRKGFSSGDHHHSPAPNSESPPPRNPWIGAHDVSPIPLNH